MKLRDLLCEPSDMSFIESPRHALYNSYGVIKYNPGIHLILLIPIDKYPVIL